MDNFDKRIKQIAKDENWEIPNEIDNNISKLLKNIEEPKTVRKRPLKVAILVASLSILTITTAFAIENIIEYFNYNKNSEYISSKEELETFGSVVSLTSKDKGIEFKLDNISVDDNYINIFYTIKGEKSIDEYYKDHSTGEKHKEAKYANPFINLEVDKIKLKNLVMQEYEAVYTSENELKGMQRINVSKYNIKNNFNLKIYTNEIFMQKGEWTVSTNIDKSKAITETRKYNVNKNIEIKNKEYSVTEEKEFESAQGVSGPEEGRTAAAAHRRSTGTMPPRKACIGGRSAQRDCPAAGRIPRNGPPRPFRKKRPRHIPPVWPPGRRPKRPGEGGAAEALAETAPPERPGRRRGREGETGDICGPAWDDGRGGYTPPQSKIPKSCKGRKWKRTGP